MYGWMDVYLQVIDMIGQVEVVIFHWVTHTKQRGMIWFRGSHVAAVHEPRNSKRIVCKYRKNLIFQM